MIIRNNPVIISFLYVFIYYTRNKMLNKAERVRVCGVCIARYTEWRSRDKDGPHADRQTAGRHADNTAETERYDWLQQLQTSELSASTVISHRTYEKTSCTATCWQYSEAN